MPFKLVCFDLDGTLVEGLEYSWQHIHEYLGTDSKQRELMMERFFEKKISYAEWAKHDVEMWRQAGATRVDLLKAIGTLSVMPGAHETLSALKKHGMKLGIISGSLDFILDSLFPGHSFDFLYINRVEFDSSGFIKKIIPTKYDFEHKARALAMEARAQDIPLRDCVFIGDNQNDVEIARIAGLSIAFNSRNKDLIDASDVVIPEKDMRKVLSYIIRQS